MILVKLNCEYCGAMQYDSPVHTSLWVISNLLGPEKFLNSSWSYINTYLPYLYPSSSRPLAFHAYVLLGIIFK
jgi:hypothetical protein